MRRGSALASGSRPAGCVGPPARSVARGRRRPRRRPAPRSPTRGPRGPQARPRASIRAARRSRPLPDARRSRQSASTSGGALGAIPATRHGDAVGCPGDRTQQVEIGRAHGRRDSNTVSAPNGRWPISIGTRSARASLGRIVLRRSRSATWSHSSKISATFHTKGRHENLNQDDRRTTRRTTNHRHGHTTADSHRPAEALAR